MSKIKIGVYPGSFDPVTLGHLDIIRRASKLVDRLVVAVAAHSGKKPLFSVDERIELLQKALKNKNTNINNNCEIIVEGFDNLLVDFVKEHKSFIVIRGVRQYSDFEYEAQMAALNAQMADFDIETIFLASNAKYQSIASRFIKQVTQLGGDVSSFVTPNVKKALEAKYK